VIAADGVHSIVARRLGLNPGWPAGAVAVDMMEETPRGALAADPATLWVAYGYAPPTLAQALTDGRASEGYAYIFPKRDHVNVGIGYVLDHFKSDVHSKPYDLQLEFVDHLRTRGLLSGDSVRRNFTPFIIPVGGPLKRPGRGRVIVAGDAGGFVNGFTAEGIYYAMATGEIAAQTVLRTRPHDVAARLASRYRRACAREFGGELRDSVLVQRHLFSDRRRIARAVTAAARDESIKQLIVDYATGRVTYKALRRRVVARAPIAAVQLGLEHISSGRAFRSWM
jgi:flavin-dependent dehydrogenase